MIRLIVIDDDYDLRDTLCNYLEHNSFNIVGKGSNGKEAVDLYQQMNPDVVIIDLSMPEYDGNYAIEKIREINPNAKIIMITGYGIYPPNLIPLKHTPNEILTKPTDFEQLIKTIHNLTEVKMDSREHGKSLDIILQNNTEELIQAHRLNAIGELSARIAHDLRNPLMIIKTSIEMMKVKEIRKDSGEFNYFSKIDKAIARMTHQIEEVLDFVKPKPLFIQTYSILDIIKSSISKTTKSENLVITLPQNDCFIGCDAKKLEIVFLNLISNAIQAMNNDGKIDVRIVDNGEDVLIEIEDNGSGIPADKLPKIFDPLFTTRQIGTGLGLPCCKTIVEKHGGVIDVKTILNKGTTFSIKLLKNLDAEIIEHKPKSSPLSYVLL